MENVKELAILKKSVKILKSPRIYALIIAAAFLLPTLMFVGCDTWLNQGNPTGSYDGSESESKSGQNNSNSNNNNSNSNSNNNGNSNTDSNGEQDKYAKYSETLKTVLTSDYYIDLIRNAKYSAESKDYSYETANKYQAIPYGFLEDEGFDIKAIKEDRLKCETEVFLLDGELYLTCRVENKASTDYYTHFVIKYNLTEQELKDLNLTHKEYSDGNQWRSVSFQAPFFIQQLSLDKEATKLSENNITKDAEKMAEKHIANKMNNNKDIDLSDFGNSISVTYLKYWNETGKIYTLRFLFFNDSAKSSPVYQSKKISTISVSGYASNGIPEIDGTTVLSGLVPAQVLEQYNNEVSDSKKTATFYNTYNSDFINMLDPKYENLYGLE